MSFEGFQPKPSTFGDTEINESARRPGNFRGPRVL